MKKIALFLMAAIAVIACEKTPEIVPEINVTSTETTLPVAGTEDLSFKVTFNTNVDWTASFKTPVDWCAVTPASGVAGDASVTVIATENKVEETRTAVLVITAGTASKEIELTQEAVYVPRLSVSPAEGAFIPVAGGSATIEVTANLDYTVTVAENDWLTVAQDGNKVTFTAAENPDYAARVVGVTFATEVEGVGATVNVTQEGHATKLWSKAVADIEGYDAAQKVRLAVYGDKLLVANTTKVFVLNPANGEVESTIALPEGVIAHNVIVDEGGNILVAADAGVNEDLVIYLIEDLANPAPVEFLKYNTGNYYGTDTGNIRVKGDIKKNAVITATVSAGAGGAVIMWEVVGGECSTWYWTSVPYSGDLVAYACAAPAGTALTDGLFYIGYGGDYNLQYVKDIVKDGTSTWAPTYVTGSSWMENYNSIATAEWNGHKYAAVLASCHFNYDDADAILLNVDDPAAAEHVYTYAGTYDVARADDWANLNWTGSGTYSDVLLVPTEEAILMVYVDGNYGAMACVAVK